MFQTVIIQNSNCCLCILIAPGWVPWEADSDTELEATRRSLGRTLVAHHCVDSSLTKPCAA